MITLSQTGDWKKTTAFLEHAKKADITRVLKKYGDLGVQALRDATPKDTGKTANSWGFVLRISRNRYSIEWTNTNIVDGVPIALVIQYGHATPTGGYVKGRDYINPALRPIFDKLAEDAWKEVVNK